MDSKELIEQSKRLITVSNRARGDAAALKGAQAQICEFLGKYAGPNSSFLKTVQSISTTGDYANSVLSSVLNSFIEYVEAGLFDEISPARQVQLDVVSDFLEQANNLLQTKGIHPAAPAVLIGATLEEFLRTWIEAEDLPLGNRKPSLDSYSQILRDTELISKQDAKDLIAWGGIRNHAAHGEWDEVSDKKRITLMLEGVNLFMRKYGAS